MAERPTECALCERVLPLTFHHLIPKKVARRPRFQKRYDRDTLAAGIYLCRLCHRAVHRFFDELTLGERLNTLEALREDPSLARHRAWAQKQRRPGFRTARRKSD